ncbi:MAG TPA: bifunctional UDP-sugar hydrolase/5'-nucleotidase [Planctomycetota bacterium]|nr:bifunctional UDP-sugar hydrolase/5'-nucleotidase [Planctomycetota bacterium]
MAVELRLGSARKLAQVLGAAFLLLVASCRAPLAQQPAAEIHLVLLHTNDVHGQVLPRSGADAAGGGIARIAACIERVKQSEPNVIVVDAGDWFQGTPEGVVDGGLPIVRALALTGYDALCVGNHDLDAGIEHLRGLLEETQLPAVLANVREAAGERVAWAAPWRIVERGGLRIALVGLLTTATPEITHADARELTFVEPRIELERARSELAGRVDLLIPIAHLGVREARELARGSPDLPLIVSGHTHDLLTEGLREGETLIVQAGSRAQAVGRVDLWIAPETHRVLRSQATIEELRAEPEPAWRNSAVEAACSTLEMQASKELEAVVGVLQAPATRRKELGSSSAGNWICDTMRRHASADVALHNKGGTRSDLPAGKVTRRALFEFLPFDNTLVTLTLRGAELEACLRKALESKAHKGLEFSGLRAFVRRGADGSVQLVRIEVGGKPVEAERLYRVVANSFLAGGGDDLTELQQGADHHDDGLLLRDLMGRELAQPGGASPLVEPRVEIVDGAAGARTP